MRATGWAFGDRRRLRSARAALRARRPGARAAWHRPSARRAYDDRPAARSPAPPGRRAGPARPAAAESFRAWWKRTDGGRSDES